MPDMWMDVDTALSEVPINKLPLIDDTDFKTREEGVVYNQAGLDLVWNFVTTAGAMTQTEVTPTDTGGDYDFVNQGNAHYTIEIPASGGASINNDTEGVGWFSGFATGILPWIGPMIGFRAAALNNALIDGGDELDVNMTQMGGNPIDDNTATLKLKQLDIQNSEGSALIAKATGGDGHGVEAAGNGTGEGINALGGATGHGIEAKGGATSGDGLNASATTNGDGIQAVAAGSNHGMRIVGAGAGSGIASTGGASGPGLHAKGGASSGAGILASAQADNDAGMELVKHGTGKDIDADEIDGIQTDLDNETDGLGALKILLDAIPTTAMRGTDNAALASVVGALADAAAVGEVTEADTVMQYIKQLINILIGAAGIGAFPAEAAPDNAVSLAEVIRAIHADVTGLNGDAMRGTNGANTTVPDAAGTAPTASEIQTEMEEDGASLLDTIRDELANGTDGLSALKALIDAVKTVVDAILLDTGTEGVVLKAAGLNADAVDEIFDEVVEGTLTFRQIIRIFLAVMAGKTTGGGTTTPTFRDNADSKARVSATVDANGNRTAMTLDGS